MKKKKKIAISIIAIGLMASLAAYPYKEPAVETMTTPEESVEEQEQKNKLQGGNEEENGEIVNNFHIQQEGEVTGASEEVKEADGGPVKQEEYKLVYNGQTGVYEEVYIGDKGDTEESEPTEGEQMTEEELKKFMEDTRDAPTDEDIEKVLKEQQKQQQTQQGGNTGNQQGENSGNGNGGNGNTGKGNGNTGKGGNGKYADWLTPEQKAELDRIFKETGGGTDGSEIMNGGGTGKGDIPDDIHINW